MYRNQSMFTSTTKETRGNLNRDLSRFLNIITSAFFLSIMSILSHIIPVLHFFYILIPHSCVNIRNPCIVSNTEKISFLPYNHRKQPVVGKSPSAIAARLPQSNRSSTIYCTYIGGLFAIPNSPLDWHSILRQYIERRKTWSLFSLARATHSGRSNGPRYLSETI